MLRRFSSQSRGSAPPPPPGADLSRANTHAGVPGIGRSDPFADLSSLDSALPPPDYQSALQATLNPPRNQRHSAPPAREPIQQAPAPRPVSATAPPPAAAAGPARGVARANSVEDPFSTLGRYDLVLLVDDSPSMVDLWSETKEALMGVVTKCVKYDKDGVDLFFLNDETHLEHVTDAGTIQEAFDVCTPSGSTPTGLQLDEILRPYIESLEDAKVSKVKIKPMILLCLTDGRADDSDLVKEVIIEMAQRLDDIRAPPRQLGISLVQVGSDADASDFLRELDDDLKAEAGVRDIVKTVPYAGRLSTDFLLNAVLGSVMRLN
ncbi:hypothetical protein RQP46_006442 [Phenoliferia psychrophenolica]